jgi:hypothetical protein
MKNKKNIYILLPIVLLIWGLVMYELFSFSKPDEVIATEPSGSDFKPAKIKERTPFSIDINYRDPFLGKMYSAQKSSPTVKKSTSKIKKIPNVVAPLVWPTIAYKGIVSDTKDKTRVFMLIIGGKTFLMKKGEIANEVFLKDGDRESIYVKYKGELNFKMIAE